MSNREKYLQIFNYLREFSKLRSKPVRDIENSETQYQEIIWLADIPEHSFFNCITFNNYSQDVDYYIKISKPQNTAIKPKFPLDSYLFREWLVEESLTDEGNFPQLKHEIEKNGHIIKLSDVPEIEKEFSDYCNSRWFDDLERYKADYNAYQNERAENEVLSKIYKRFFSIYNKAQQFGEEFELIIGAGFLYFRESDRGPRIARHILTTKVEIKFLKDSSIIVLPNPESEIKLETDAIDDLSEIFSSQSVIDAENKCIDQLKMDNISDIFDPNIKEAIQIFAERLRDDSKFVDSLEKPDKTPITPTVCFAPSLILRKRNTRSFTQLYETIIKNISQANADLNISTMNELIGTSSEGDHGDNRCSAGQDSGSFKDDMIYFPKKHNDEQIQILNKTSKNNKVLVQGPPGTGKSHTIANLICHLLANGNRILVTAYTKRALEVLKKQLPDDFKNLAVNFLGGESISIQELESSVNTIIERLYSENSTELKNEIEKLMNELAKTKSETAYLTNELIRVREKASRKLVLNKFYEGTLLEIAEKVEKDSTIYDWYKDDFSDTEHLQLVEEVKHLASSLTKYRKFNCEVFNLQLPSKDQILSPTELQDYQVAVNKIGKKSSEGAIKSTIISNDLNELLSSVSELYHIAVDIEQNHSPLKDEILKDSTDNRILWLEKLNRTNKLLSQMSEDKLKDMERNVEISYPTNRSLIQLKNDAETLFQHIKNGNKLYGFLFNLKKFFWPRDIKEKLYFIEEVRINGSACDTVGEFEKVLDDIKIRQDFDEMEKIWKQEPQYKLKTYYDAFGFYSNLAGDLKSVLSLVLNFNVKKMEIERSSSVKIISFSSESIQRLESEINFNILVYQVDKLKNKMKSVFNYLSAGGFHSIAEALKKDIEEVEIFAYEQDLSKLDELVREKEEYLNFRQLRKKLDSYFPQLLSNIENGRLDESVINNLSQAIYYRNAVEELRKLSDQDYENQLNLNLVRLEQTHDKLIEKIASKKAWMSVIQKLTEDKALKKHLQAWVDAVKKIGKTGRGKRALKFRKIAQQEMEKCKESIPCWIMPLYKVAETIKPEQGMYDYVIIDEASQVGPDAIFLLYISKNVIIVGDDKQVSPEYVGVDSETMAPHIKRFLNGIEFADFYGTEFSFFDHARRFCDGVIVLREHFRCMPEIIEFSNKYFYSPEGKRLYPLRQYSENRLEPLKSVFCQSGYIEGQYQNIVNKVEAEKIAETIAQLVSDKIYDGKTFGVIALQGNKQGALIESMVLDRIGEKEFHKRRLICGNSASFQGDERDIIFLSLITAANHKRAPLVKPEDERRFNVAVSRARDQIWLFHSVSLEDLSNTDDLRYKLMDHFYHYKENRIIPNTKIERKSGILPHPFESWFEVDVYNDIVSRGYQVIPQYEVAKGKYRIDLVVVLNDGIKIAVECDGDKYHDAEHWQNDLMRQRVLERCGWQFFRVRGCQYYCNRQGALEPLWKMLSSNSTNKVIVFEKSSWEKLDTDKHL
jgi:superfamily I DNA and/or RNA helicase/very-short-patch-repair endonuclease